VFTSAFLDNLDTNEPRDLQRHVYRRSSADSTTVPSAVRGGMTPDERRNPDVIGRRRTARIATGSGTSIQEVKQLLKQFNEMQRMLKMVGEMTGEPIAAAPKKKKKKTLTKHRATKKKY
jgi:signal recognition particle GTPase